MTWLKQSVARITVPTLSLFAVVHVLAILTLFEALACDGKCRATSANGDASESLSSQTPRLVTQLGHTGPINAAAFSKDAKFAVTVEAARAIVWETSSGEELRRLDEFGGSCVACSPTDSWVLTGGGGNEVTLWDATNGQVVRRFTWQGKIEVLDEISSLGFSPDGKRIFTAKDDTARLWDVATGQEIKQFHSDFGPIELASLSPKGTFLLVCGTGANIPLQLFETATGKNIRQFKVQSVGTTAIAFSPDQSVLAAATGDKIVTLYQTSSGNKISAFAVKAISPFSIHNLAFMPDGKQIVVGTGPARLWNIAQKVEVARFGRWGEGTTDRIALSPDGQLLLGFGSSFFFSAGLWDTRATNELRRFEGRTHSVRKALFAADGERILTEGDNVACCWDTRTGTVKCTGAISNEWDPISNDWDPRNTGKMCFSRNGQFIFSEEPLKHSARIFNAATGQIVREIENNWPTGDYHHGPILSNDGKFVLIGINNLACIYSTDPLRELARFPVQGKSVATIDLSPDARMVWTTDNDGIGQLWDVQSSKEICSFPNLDSGDDGNVFSNDGRSVMLRSKKGALAWGDVTNGREVEFLKFNPEYPIEYLAVSPDRRRVLMDGLIWDLVANGESACFELNHNPFECAAFSPDSLHIVTAHRSNTAKVWSPTLNKELCTLINFYNGTWAVVSPDGRFDTNHIEQIQGLHWVFPSEPLRALSPELFFRQYYVPGLLHRLLKDQPMQAVPTLATLNRTQPEVKILDVRVEANSTDSVAATVEVISKTAEVQKDAAGHFLRSGVYDLRLFRDGQLVGQRPEVPSEAKDETAESRPEEEPKQWRKAHEIALDADGKTTLTLHNIQLPKQNGEKKVLFTAYAFNSDRVKSLTTTPYEFSIPASVKSDARPGRAYLITMGVNANESHWNLEVAVSSAEKARALLHKKLLEKYSSVIDVPLYSDLESDSSQVAYSRARKTSLQAALDLLAGRSVKPELRQEVDPNNELQKARPDDAVVLYVASHGYADPEGNRI